jgi:hypothetical protein
VVKTATDYTTNWWKPQKSYPCGDLCNTMNGTWWKLQFPHMFLSQQYVGTQVAVHPKLSYGAGELSIHGHFNILDFWNSSTRKKDLDL